MLVEFYLQYKVQVIDTHLNGIVYLKQLTIEPFHPYRPVWYVPDQGLGDAIIDILGLKWFTQISNEIYSHVKVLRSMLRNDHCLRILMIILSNHVYI